MRRIVVAVIVMGAGCGGSSPETAPAPAPAAAAAPAALPIVITAHDQYYDIDGSSAGALRESIRRLGPAGGDDALTVWELESTYRATPDGADCGLKDVKVTLTVTTTLPRWAPPSDATATLRQTWRTYVQHVRQHEAGHRTIAERNARDLVRVLQALRAPTCAELETLASRRVEEVVADGRARNRQYDVDTKHGQTQGVDLGP